MNPQVIALAGLLLFAVKTPASGIGFGGMATGGLGKPVFIVTTLRDQLSHGSCDAHHCSLRDALAACKVAGGGNVYFNGLSGNINIGTGGGNLVWDCPNSTIDGSTGANHGVQIVEGPATAVSDQFLLDADNVIIRYMRFRCTHFSGDPSSPGCTGGSRNILAILGGHKIWIDHCSFEWGTKMLGDIGDGPRATTDITYSNNIFAESLGPGAILIGAGATRVSLYRNAFISNSGRQPDIIPHSVLFGVDTVVVELIENYYYNFITAIQPDADDPKSIDNSLVGRQRLAAKDRTVSARMSAYRYYIATNLTAGAFGYTCRTTICLTVASSGRSTAQVTAPATSRRRRPPPSERAPGRLMHLKAATTWRRLHVAHSPASRQK